MNDDAIEVEVLPVPSGGNDAAPRLSSVPADQLAAQLVTTLLTAKGGLAKYDEIVTEAIQMMRRDFKAELDAVRDQLDRATTELKKAGDAWDKASQQAREERSRRESAERRCETLKADADAWRARNTAEITDFVASLQREAVRQRDAHGMLRGSKAAEDWLWTVASLSTAAVQSSYSTDRAEYLQLIVACAAACLNWHASAVRRPLSATPGAAPDAKPGPAAGRKQPRRRRN